ncbi:hypothetical protein Tco_1507439 [Tanacetum coccineum]
MEITVVTLVEELAKIVTTSRYVVPTGRVNVPAGRYVVPTGRVKVPAGRYVVPTGKDKFIVSAGRTKVIPAVDSIASGRRWRKLGDYYYVVLETVEAKWVMLDNVGDGGACKVLE